MCNLQTINILKWIIYNMFQINFITIQDSLKSSCLYCSFHYWKKPPLFRLVLDYRLGWRCRLYPTLPYDLWHGGCDGHWGCPYRGRYHRKSTLPLGCLDISETCLSLSSHRKFIQGHNQLVQTHLPALQLVVQRTSGSQYQYLSSLSSKHVSACSTLWTCTRQGRWFGSHVLCRCSAVPTPLVSRISFYASMNQSVFS